MAGINVTEGTAINGLKNISWPHNYDVGVSILNTLQYVTFQKEVFLKPTTLMGETIKIIAQILIPIQAAFLALSLRNRFRR